LALAHSIVLLNGGDHIGFLDYNVPVNLLEAQRLHGWWLCKCQKGSLSYTVF